MDENTLEAESSSFMTTVWEKIEWVFSMKCKLTDAEGFK
jgi:hypothetical protein